MNSSRSHSVGSRKLNCEKCDHPLQPNRSHVQILRPSTAASDLGQCTGLG